MIFISFLTFHNYNSECLESLVSFIIYNTENVRSSKYSESEVSNKKTKLEITQNFF